MTNESDTYGLPDHDIYFCHNGLFSCSSIIISRTSLGLRISQTSRTSWRRQLGALGRYQRHMRPLSDVQIFDQSFKKRSHLVDRIFLFSDKRLLGPRCTSGVQSGFGWYLVFFYLIRLDWTGLLFLWFIWTSQPAEVKKLPTHRLPTPSVSVADGSLRFY